VGFQGGVEVEVEDGVEVWFVIGFHGGKVR
jgi:hypothetical protein